MSDKDQQVGRSAFQYNKRGGSGPLARGVPWHQQQPFLTGCQQHHQQAGRKERRGRWWIDRW